METLNKHFRKLADAAFKRYGFAQQELVSHWPLIVGDGLAAICTPERMRWPKASDDSIRKAGGTVVVRAAAGCGLDVQQSVPALLERINQFLGYQAVTTIKVTQSHSLAAQKPKKTPIADLVSTRLDRVEDPELKAALARLGGGVAAAAARSPQAK